MLQTFVFIVLFIVAVVERVPAQQTCARDSDCGVNQCCTDPSAPIALSKRDESAVFRAPTPGLCMAYLAPGEDCSRIWWQGERVCGCALGYVCRYFPDAPSRKRILPIGGIRGGHSECAIPEVE